MVHIPKGDGGPIPPTPNEGSSALKGNITLSLSGAASMKDRIILLEGALMDLTTKRFHDALCQCFEAYELEHEAFARAEALVAAK